MLKTSGVVPAGTKVVIEVEIDRMANVPRLTGQLQAKVRYLRAQGYILLLVRHADLEQGAHECHTKVQEVSIAAAFSASPFTPLACRQRQKCSFIARNTLLSSICWCKR